MSARESTILADTEVVSQLPKSTETLINNSVSYFVLQIRLATFMLFFWSIVVCFLTLKYEFRKIRPMLVSTALKRFSEIKHVKNLLDLKNSLLEFIFYLDIRRIQTIIRETRATLSTIKNTILSTRPKYNLTALIANIKSTIIHFRNISKSFAQIAVSILQCVKKPLEMVGRVKQGIVKVKKEIAQLWMFIEQIVQIVRLPIEILKAVSKFTVNIWTFLGRLQRPNLKIG